MRVLSLVLLAVLSQAAVPLEPVSRLKAEAARASQEATQAPRVIEVVARRYAFEPAEIEVLEGERVRLLVKSGDGLHGFEIKPLGIKKEIPRGGEAVPIEFTAPAPGRYPVLCSEYCGDGHGDMKGALVVNARSEVP